MSRYDATGSQGSPQDGAENGVLANKFSITTSQEIDELELLLLNRLYLSVIGENLPKRRISVGMIKEWHQLWLGNVYDWAGQERSVQLSKGGFMFAPSGQISKLLNEFEAEYLAHYTPCAEFSDDQIIEAIAITHVELILIHPFREGNGRISRLLADVMAVQAGYLPLNYEGWESQKDRYIAAIHQGLDRNYEPMKQFVADALMAST